MSHIFQELSIGMNIHYASILRSHKVAIIERSLYIIASLISDGTIIAQLLLEWRYSTDHTCVRSIYDAAEENDFLGRQ